MGYTPHAAEGDCHPCDIAAWTKFLRGDTSKTVEEHYAEIVSTHPIRTWVPPGPVRESCACLVSVPVYLACTGEHARSCVDCGRVVRQTLADS